MNVSTIRNLPRLAIHAVAAGALLLGALAYAWWAFSGTATERAKFEAVDITGVDWGKDFELTDFNQKQRTLADLSYGVTDDLTLDLRMPYVRRTNIREGESAAGI